MQGDTPCLGPTWNPRNPHATRYPIKLAYMQAYATDMAYVTLPGHESPKHFRRRLYTTLRIMALATSTFSEIRVITMHPTLNWPDMAESTHCLGPGREIRLVPSHT